MDWLVMLPPLLIWAAAIYGSPYLKTHRRVRAGMVSVMSGGLMFAALRGDDATFLILFCAAGTALLAMFVILLWSVGVSDARGKAR